MVLLLLLLFSLWVLRSSIVDLDAWAECNCLSVYYYKNDIILLMHICPPLTSFLPSSSKRLMSLSSESLAKSMVDGDFRKENGCMSYNGARSRSLSLTANLYWERERERACINITMSVLLVNTFVETRAWKWFVAAQFLYHSLLLHHPLPGCVIPAHEKSFSWWFL